MINSSRAWSSIDCRSCLFAAFAALLLSTCGAGDGGADNRQAASTGGSQLAPILATGTTTLQLSQPVLPDVVGMQLLQRLFHAAPLLLAAPGDVDESNSDASARHRPHRTRLSGEFEHLSSTRLTVEAMKEFRQRRHEGRRSAHDGTVTLMGAGIEIVTGTVTDSATPSAQAAPMAGGGVISTYTPAQIRAAYGLSALAVAGSALSASAAAQMGSGPTIYVVNAMHDPDLVAELAAFNQRFGLPACTTRTLPISTNLPLAAAVAGNCELIVVYATAGGAMTGTAPAFNAGWATEIALDVQWAHATAPLARIILIEAPDASVNSLLASIGLANIMGPLIVSMSFGANEGNWTAAIEAVFAKPGMTYLAATGDSGAAVSWPAVSPNVVAVGGTTLTYSGSGSGSGLRSEVGWSGTGGGTSLYTPTPAYQSNAVPGMGRWRGARWPMSPSTPILRPASTSR